MDTQVSKRLVAIHDKSKANPDWVWQKGSLYNLMYKEDIYVMAYEKIKSKPGNMTAGPDGTTLDGLSVDWIEKTIEQMKTMQYKFSPARATKIPKANGKTRQLSVASPKDKVVQEVIRSILEVVYEPTFSQYSHGFRASKGCHTALKQVSQKWSGTCWIIEGDIKGCFDNIPHQRLLNVIRERIQDERLVLLIGKSINAGWLENNKVMHSKVGTPQGSVLSPILANIYLDKFDKYIEEIIKELECGKKRKYNPEYRKACRLVEKASKDLNQEGLDKETRQAAWKGYKEAKKNQLATPSGLPDPSFIRVKFVRYADDWMIGVNGSHDLAVEIKDMCADYLSTELGLELSLDKTHIRKAKVEQAKFLGVNIRIGDTNKKIGTLDNKSNNYTKRTTGWMPKMYAPTEEIIKRLQGKGICDSNGFPTSVTGWTQLDDVQIILQYNAINRGILNYYSFVDNYCKLSRVQYILQYSAAKTLAHKHKTKMTKIFAKRGKDLHTTVSKDGKTLKETRLYLNDDWKHHPERFIGAGKPFDWDRYITLRTSTRLYDYCAICGSGEDVQMHHVKHIRKIGQKVEGFTRLMAIMNRKQIPVCAWCHWEIHRGNYDGRKLSQLADRQGVDIQTE